VIKPSVNRHHPARAAVMLLLQNGAAITQLARLRR
jgi:hypothetical protein